MTSLFESIYDKNDGCHVCMWQKTKMCPHQENFIGNHLRDPEKISNRIEICHRYMITNQERQRRWQITMQKLHENLN